MKIPAVRVIEPRVRGHLIIEQDRVVSVAQWAKIAGLADDGTSLATARRILAKGDGPTLVQVGPRKRGVSLSDHARWARSQTWAKYLAASSAAAREKRQRRSNIRSK